MKNTGYVQPTSDPKRYVLGASPLRQNVLQPDGQWIKFCPEFEPQSNGWDSFGCTVFGSLNILEMIEKRLYNE